MGMFVIVKVDHAKCPPGCSECAAVCPVKVFDASGSRVTTICDNEDECTFCDLCLDRCPAGALTIGTTYSPKVRTSPARA